MTFKKIDILSRKSDLAVIQAREFGQILSSNFPSIKLNYITKSTSGDKDLKTPLSEMPTEGVFTDDLRDELIKKNCDQVVSIPMSGNIESLNVSVATAITLFEIKRQRESS